MHYVNAAHKHKLLRPQVIEQLGLSGQNDVVLRAQHLFATHISNSTAYAIRLQLRTAVYRIVLRWGDSNVFEQLLKVCTMLLNYMFCEEYNIFIYATGINTCTLIITN